MKDLMYIALHLSTYNLHGILDRIVAMLTKMGGRSYSVKESEIVYYSGNDDTDGDPDTDKNRTKIFSKRGRQA